MKKTKTVYVGGVPVGGGHPVTIQSMLNVEAHDFAGNVAQALALEAAGCQIIRAAIPDREAVGLINALKNALKIPVVADIHFDYRLALEAAEAGVDKIRINPGNIGAPERIKAVADLCRRKKIPIRIGVNSGSVEKEILAKYGAPNAQALCESALHHAALLEQFNFTDIVLSMKSSHVKTMVEAYELVSRQCDYPLHLGVTEAGSERMGLIKSSAGLGALLLRGVGDTLRVSLTADPLREIAAARDILRALGLRREGVEIVSCPTCGRTKIDLISLAEQAEKALAGCKKPLKVAIMGCVVNGPGEAKEADLGIAGGTGAGVIFKKGVVLRSVPEEQLLEELLLEIRRGGEGTDNL